MDLAEIIGHRPVPAAGLLVTITQRCPLHCAHCSSSSTMDGRAPDPRRLTRFVRSFSRADRPEVLMMTGGEPLLLPDLVVELARAARPVGTRSAVLTGAYFARRTRIPAPILRAARAVDHFSVSVDAFHEREVPRDAVFRLLRQLLDGGVPVSLHAVGAGADDPYLVDLVAHTGRVFGDRVPMLVNTVRSVGRAAAWAAAAPDDPTGDGPAPAAPRPCAMAAWPTVAHDGTVVACCNQSTVDRRPVPGHLLLGHIDVDDWATVRERALTAPVLRMIRATGPAYLAARFDPTAGPVAGFCDGCRRLGERPDVLRRARLLGAGPVGELLDRQASLLQVRAGPAAFVRRHGCARYADLVTTGSAAPVEAGS